MTDEEKLIALAELREETLARAREIMGAGYESAIVANITVFDHWLDLSSSEYSDLLGQAQLLGWEYKVGNDDLTTWLQYPPDEDHPRGQVTLFYELEQPVAV